MKHLLRSHISVPIIIGLVALGIMGHKIPLAWAADQTTTPRLAPGAESQWQFVTGKWRFTEGTLEQTNLTRQSAALLTKPAWGDCSLTVDMNIRPAGGGVRAGAILLRATGTLSYYWLHLDSKFHQVILVRSTPAQSWSEIARKKCPALTEDAWHTVKVDAKGTEIAVFIDNTEALSARDTTLAGGRIGLGTSQGNVVFRNLKIEGEELKMPEPLKNECPPYKVISQGEAAGSYQAFPDACRLQNGDIVAVFYAGYGHVSLPNNDFPKGGRICMVRSRDEGRTWSEPRILYDDDVDNRDPHIAQLSDGTLICSFFSLLPEGKAYKVVGVQITRSHDGGETWETPAQTLTNSDWAVSAPVREMPDGTLILGVYYCGTQGAWGGVLRSTDHGKTWSAPIPIGQESKLRLDAETDFVQLKDGSLYATLRGSNINMRWSRSSDLGLTWTPVQDIGFQAHAPHFTRLSTGEILMTHRIPETAMHVSRDECKTWQGPYVIDHVGGAYPATVELKDGTVLAIYYEEGEGSAVRAQRFRLKPDGIEPLAF